jgi:hypothetical protein
MQVNENGFSVAIWGDEQFSIGTFVMKNGSSQSKSSLRETVLAWAAICATFGAFGLGVYSQWERTAMPTNTTSTIDLVDSPVAAMPAHSSLSKITWMTKREWPQLDGFLIDKDVSRSSAGLPNAFETAGGERDHFATQQVGCGRHEDEFQPPARVVRVFVA